MYFLYIVLPTPSLSVCLPSYSPRPSFRVVALDIPREGHASVPRSGVTQNVASFLNLISEERSRIIQVPCTAISPESQPLSHLKVTRSATEQLSRSVDAIFQRSTVPAIQTYSTMSQAQAHGVLCGGINHGSSSCDASESLYAEVFGNSTSASQIPLVHAPSSLGKQDMDPQVISHSAASVDMLLCASFPDASSDKDAGQEEEFSKDTGEGRRATAPPGRPSSRR